MDFVAAVVPQGRRSQYPGRLLIKPEQEKKDYLLCQADPSSDSAQEEAA